MRRVVDRLSHLLSIVAGVALFLLMAITGTDVLRRALIDGRSVPGAIEYAEIILVGLVYLSLAQTQRSDGHISVAVMTARLPPRFARALTTTGLLVVTLVLGWLVVASAGVAWRSWNTGEFRMGLAQVPIWPARALIPLGAFFLLLQTLYSAADALGGRLQVDTETAAQAEL